MGLDRSLIGEERAGGTLLVTRSRLRLFAGEQVATLELTVTLADGTVTLTGEATVALD